MFPNGDEVNGVDLIKKKRGGRNFTAIHWIWRSRSNLLSGRKMLDQYVGKKLNRDHVRKRKNDTATSRRTSKLLLSEERKGEGARRRRSTRLGIGQDRKW